MDLAEVQNVCGVNFSGHGSVLNNAFPFVSIAIVYKLLLFHNMNHE